MSRIKFLTLMLVVVALMLGTAMTAVAQNTLVVWADGERAPLLQELADDVEAELGIQLEVVQIGLGEARDQLLVAGPVGEGPDILISAHDSIGLFVANGAIVPLELGEVADSFSDAALNLFTYQDQLWGIPYTVENIALICNADIVPEAPTTWEEVRTLTEELRASETAQYGFVVQTGNTYHNYPITSAFGGYIFGTNDDGTFDVSDIGLNSEGGLAAAEWLSGMYTDGLMPADVNDDVAFQLFEDGDAACIVTGPWFSQRIVDTGLNWTVNPLPTSEMGPDMEIGQPFSGGQGFVISAFSENQLLAEIFLLDYVASTDFMQAIFDQGGRPPSFAGVDTSSLPPTPFFEEAGVNAIPMPAVPEMGAVWASSDNALTLISQGGDPVEAYETAVSQISEAIEVQQSGAVNSITLVGSVQDEAGCAGDWDPACETTFMEETEDGVYTFVATLPAGEYEYKVAFNADWAENYGAGGERDGANIALVLDEETEVTFTFDFESKVVTDSVNN